ncbi:DNA mismatch repair endonuclease MutL [Bacillus fonticola]|uniref:DNA mismatch repair endonuclease MutL n=1 Tax=Bacillus fonticola TaxID=2728853 RepID=UPI001D154ADB|nr:DNA mismatch repair endonuclease MutL [Bacillus fonticola]
MTTRRPIRELGEALANKIAAGEVVERPAAVVKELVENALDAKAKTITVSCQEAGLQEIRIIDDGVGIPQDEVLTAFQRHATSKLEHESDLFRIRTLGFRGEALPSIASVSKFTCRTAYIEEEAGTELTFEGGRLLTHKKAKARNGTEMIVRQLFYNTPARLKYVKTVHTELGHITDIINRLALSFPHVSFRLVHNGKTLLHTNGNGHVQHVLAAIYGVETAKKFHKVEANSLDFSLEGWISHPDVSRASKQGLSVFVNSRYVRHYGIQQAILDGYKTKMMIGRFPLVVLQIQMDPVLLDVNVHPSKLEVRFSEEEEVKSFVSKGILSVLSQQAYIPQVSEPIKRKSSEQSAFRFSTDYAPPTYTPEETKTEEFPSAEIIREGGEGHLVEGQTDPIVYAVSEDKGMSVTDQVAVTQEETVPTHALHDADIIGQLHGTYILAENASGLFLIDQHAAQERLKYEFYRDKIAEVDNTLQTLLFPLQLDLTNDEAQRLPDITPVLEKVGVFLEPFGASTYIVKEHPTWFPPGFERETTEELIQMAFARRSIDIAHYREEAAILMSCKQSIKANHKLRRDEMERLLYDLQRAEDPFTCPHGRPVTVHLTTYELEKWFKRIQD